MRRGGDERNCFHRLGSNGSLFGLVVARSVQYDLQVRHREGGESSLLPQSSVRQAYPVYRLTP
jgi:hypothetical protein